MSEKDLYIELNLVSQTMWIVSFTKKNILQVPVAKICDVAFTVIYYRQCDVANHLCDWGLSSLLRIWVTKRARWKGALAGLATGQLLLDPPTRSSSLISFKVFLPRCVRQATIHFFFWVPPSPAAPWFSTLLRLAHSSLYLGCHFATLSHITLKR